jgi:hypothetical protein
MQHRSCLTAILAATLAFASASANATPFEGLRSAFVPNADFSDGGVADLNGDGLDDIYAVGTDAPGIQPIAINSFVFALADGSGGYGPPQAVNIGDLPFAAHAADLDNDGDNDMIVAVSTGMRWYANNSGTFTLGGSATYSADQITSFCTGDFNGDGNTDIAGALAGFMGGAGFVTFKQTSPGTFAAGVGWGGPAMRGGIAAVRDNGHGRDNIWIDNSGDLDVYGSDSNGDFVFLGTETGWGGTRFTGGDFNNDGIQDVLVSDTFYGGVAKVVLGNAAGIPASSQTVDGGASTYATFTDIDGDDFPDVIAGSPAVLRLYRNDAGTLVLQDTLDHFSTVLALPANLDNALPLDIVHLQQETALPLLVAAGPTLPEAPYSVATERFEPGLDAIVVADFTGDGRDDVAAYSLTTRRGGIYYDSLRVYGSDGLGGLSLLSQVPADMFSPPSAADIDGDGDMDLLNCTFVLEGAVFWNENLGGGNFAGTTELFSYPDMDGFDLLVGDLNGDALPDLVTTFYTIPSRDGERGTTIRSMRVSLNQGNGTFTTGDTVEVALQPYALLHIGDVNGDGDADIVIREEDDISAFLGDGTGTAFTRSLLFTVDPLTTNTAFAFADFDGDSDLDIVSSGTGIEAFALYRNDGTGAFAAPESSPAPARLMDLVALDVDLDGDVDLVTAGEQVIVYLNDGTGEFAPSSPATLYAGNGSSQIAAGDLDNDGVTDIVVADNEASRVYPFINTSGLPSSAAGWTLYE